MDCCTPSSCSDGTTNGDRVSCVGLTEPNLCQKFLVSALMMHYMIQMKVLVRLGAVCLSNSCKRCATCNNGGDPSSILTCTGLTGYTFSEGPPSSCKDYRGADVGSAIDRASCEGTSNGNTYVADDSLMDATSKESCEGVATNHTYSPAVPNLCKDNLNQDAGNANSQVLCEGGHNGGQPTAANSWLGPSLDGAKTFTTEGTAFSLQLTEAQRVRAIRVSEDADTGGDGFHAVMLEAEPGFVKDVATNPNMPLSSMICTEIPDIVPSVINTVELFLQVGSVNDGQLQSQI